MSSHAHAPTPVEQLGTSESGARMHYEGLTPQQWGMLAFLGSEVAFFGTLIVTYLTYLGQDKIGPTPKVLSLPLTIGTTICLLSSSATIHFAEHALKHGRQALFCGLWGLTIALGILFLVGTGFEWHDLIYKHHLTLNRNLFGTTFYTLVGFHGLHVTAGVIVMLILLGLALRGAVNSKHRTGIELASWYWHFVDVVWIAVFFVVYVAGR